MKIGSIYMQFFFLFNFNRVAFIRIKYEDDILKQHPLKYTYYFIYPLSRFANWFMGVVYKLRDKARSGLEVIQIDPFLGWYRSK